MRTVVMTMQATLDNRIALPDGSFWDPFPFGDDEQFCINRVFAGADTWVMSRPLYQAVAPWWDVVARGDVPSDVREVSAATREFGQIFGRLRRVVISRTPVDGADEVISGDVAARLDQLRREEGRDIMLAAGPSVVDPLLRVPGLIGRIVQPVHPRILGAGPQLYGSDIDLRLRLNAATAFDGGTVILDYSVETADPPAGTASHRP